MQSNSRPNRYARHTHGGTQPAARVDFMAASTTYFVARVFWNWSKFGLILPKNRAKRFAIAHYRYIYAAALTVF